MKRFWLEQLLAPNGGKRVARMDRPPRYSAPHHVTGLRMTGEREWEEPEAVLGRGTHRPDKRGRVSSIREVPEAYADDLARIDTARETLRMQLAELDRQERAVIDAAWPTSKPVTVESVLEIV